MFDAKHPIACRARNNRLRPEGSPARSHMTGRLAIGVLAAGCGITVASLIPEIPQAVRYAVELVTGAEPVRAVETGGGAEQRKSKGDSGVEISEERATIRLTEEQIETSGIELAAVQDGTLVRRIVVPGTIVPDADRIARVSVKLSATVAELRKKLGDTVEKGEVIAVLESREVANAKSECLAARLNNDLQRNLYERDKILWDRHIIAEQIVLRSQGAAAQAKINLDIARQKLFALGVTESEVAALPDEPGTALRRQEVRAPISGRVVDRKVDLGAVVGRDNLETELFTVGTSIGFGSNSPSVRPTFRGSPRGRRYRSPPMGFQNAPSERSSSSVRYWTRRPIRRAWWRRSPILTATGAPARWSRLR